MPEYLFLVSIGPVQEFIASARKSRDLWYGSWMLSAVSKAAARAIQAHGGDVKLIFPAPEDNAALEREDTSNVANKILALVTVSPTTLGKEVRVAVDRELSQGQRI